MRRAHESRGGEGTSDRGGKLRPAEALATAGVRPHKSKGQNFLVQPHVADRIVAAAEIGSGEDVIEIGPGLGILSERLAARALRRLILIELDERLASQLGTRFAGDPRVTVINHDFLALAPRDLIALAPRDYCDSAAPELVVAETREFSLDAPLRVVANLPFNVAAAILERLCSMQGRIAGMVLMFQREVAERIRARPGAGNYGALSVYTALYWEIVGHFRVAAGSFHPKPKVDAEVLTFAPRRPMPFALAEESAVLATVRAAFSAPRKILRNAVGNLRAIEPTALEAAFASAAINPAVRAATLAADDFIRLARALDWHRDLESDREHGRDA